MGNMDSRAKAFPVAHPLTISNHFHYEEKLYADIAYQKRSHSLGYVRCLWLWQSSWPGHLCFG